MNGNKCELFEWLQIVTGNYSFSLNGHSSVHLFHHWQSFVMSDRGAIQYNEQYELQHLCILSNISVVRELLKKK